MVSGAAGVAVDHGGHLLGVVMPVGEFGPLVVILAPLFFFDSLFPSKVRMKTIIFLNLIIQR